MSGKWPGSCFRNILALPSQGLGFLSWAFAVRQKHRLNYKDLYDAPCKSLIPHRRKYMSIGPTKVKVRAKCLQCRQSNFPTVNSSTKSQGTLLLSMLRSLADRRTMRLQTFASAIANTRYRLARNPTAPLYSTTSLTRIKNEILPM